MNSEKIYFLTPEQSPLSASDLALLHSVKSEILRRPGLTEVFQPEEADAILLQEKNSHKNWRYIDELESDPIIGRLPHKAYTINTDDGATGLLRGVYTCLSRARYDFHFHRAVPYAASPVESLYSRWRQSDETPPYLASWRGSLRSNPLRAKLCDNFSTHPLFRMETSDSWFNHDSPEKEHYVDLLLSARFSLCPAGWAGVTFRIYESMALGVCPVILADSFVPPEGPDWPAFTIRVPEKEYRSLESILSAKEGQSAEMGRQARLAWERHFSPQAVIGCYADALMACIQTGRTGSRDAERKRWRSRQMFQSNGWTLPQRLHARLSRSFAR